MALLKIAEMTPAPLLRIPGKVASPPSRKK
jgi:hypothetical protein